MNHSLRATRLPAGVTFSSASGAGVLKQGMRAQQAQPFPRRAERSNDTSFSIKEPMRFHRARYELLTRSLHGKFNLAAALLTSLSLSMLGWRAKCGEPISPERWLCGALSGWFIVAMARLALFTCLAAPRGINYAQGRLRISGLGMLRPGQLLHWSVQRGVRISAQAKPGVQLQIGCRWCGYERQWMMLMEEGPEIERLQQLLEMHLPHSTYAANAAPLHRTIQIEAGMLSQ